MRSEVAGDAVSRPGATWWSLGLFVRELVPSGGLTVAEALMPEGATPPLHVHEDLDDSFFVLEGQLVVRCGDSTSVASAGDFVPFPKGVPHTFRVLGGPARVLNVHANDSFMRALRQLGRRAEGEGLPPSGEGPTSEELISVMSASGITLLGDSMSEDEARSYL